MPLQSRLNRLVTPFDDEYTADSADSSQQNNYPAGGEVGLNEAVGNNTNVGNNRILQLSPMMQQYQQMMQNYPKPEDYKASKTRRVLAALAGGMAGGGAAALHNPNAPLVGYEISHDIVSSPYDTAVKNYNARAKALGEGAGIEERGIAAQGRLEESQSRIQELQNHNDMLERKYKQESADRESERQRKQEESDKRYAELEKKLTETAREADARVAQAQNETARKGDATATMAALTEARIAATKAQHELDNARRDKQLEDTMREHKAQIDKMKSDSDLANEKIRLLENPPGKEVVKEEQPGFFGRLLGLHGKSTVTTTTPTRYNAMPTTTVAGASGTTEQVPAGAKPGGKWITTSSGTKVYQEP